MGRNIIAIEEGGGTAIKGHTIDREINNRTEIHTNEMERRHKPAEVQEEVEKLLKEYGRVWAVQTNGQGRENGTVNRDVKENKRMGRRKWNSDGTQREEVKETEEERGGTEGGNMREEETTREKREEERKEEGKRENGVRIQRGGERKEIIRERKRGDEWERGRRGRGRGKGE